ncbi:hypothetical protein ASF44_16210 [Pseudorhodoferax sp. Leaf274]|nr:hypothetical protein ASF44_16210 [Pseudorhodoferax sp. Leaf274]
MLKDEVINITCPRCTRPLLAFRQTKANKKEGSHTVQSYGANVRLEDPPSKGAYAVCDQCGTETAFDPRLLGIK